MSSIARLQQSTESLPTQEFIAWMLDRFGRRRMVVTTGFGMEGCALIDMLAAYHLPLTVVYLDTWFLFPETHALRDRLASRYPELKFVNRGTTLTPEEQEARYGPELWRSQPDLCCHLRKVEPMREALAGAELWVTAIARGQSAARAHIDRIEWDERYGLIKANPLADWDRARVWAYVRRRDVPYNPLHERGYPSIGCTHCTAPLAGVAISEYRRDGRWPGTGKTECGLHLKPASAEGPRP